MITADRIDYKEGASWTCRYTFIEFEYDLARNAARREPSNVSLKNIPVAGSGDAVCDEYNSETDSV